MVWDGHKRGAEGDVQTKREGRWRKGSIRVSPLQLFLWAHCFFSVYNSRSIYVECGNNIFIIIILIIPQNIWYNIMCSNIALNLLVDFSTISA